MGLRSGGNGPRGPCVRPSEARYWRSRTPRRWPRMIENHIRMLLDAPDAGDGAPTLADIEELLTAGYARAMALEGEQWRLQRRLVDVAMRLADDYNELQARELRKLAHELREIEDDLVGIRALIRSLRARANDTRAA
jgi:hypothetical protein